MRKCKILLPIFAAAALLFAAATPSPAQVSFGVNVGPVPDCPYGYYDYAPYSCAPYGYYGPEWFTNGVFIGAGPWFHGPHNFYGHINNRYDPHHGYHGAYPGHGAYHAPADNFKGFHGNKMSDGRGHRR